MEVCGVMVSVTYDHKAIVIDGKRRILMSDSIHYPRSTPQAKDGGLDVIQTYVFWNGHEPSPGKHYFEDRYDLVKFVKQAGLYIANNTLFCRNSLLQPHRFLDTTFGPNFLSWAEIANNTIFCRTDLSSKTRLVNGCRSVFHLAPAPKGFLQGFFLLQRWCWEFSK
ncbi:hypothetical protein VNO78_32749 [Psophocarpus tetragonolobus]|uniref:beta-galactosidase n=1 Tax=Psophocarpus tetragonolobus TaxID=3891 RepID=A0AAN9P163_PSOTE